MFKTGLTEVKPVGKIFSIMDASEIIGFNYLPRVGSQRSPIGLIGKQFPDTPQPPVFIWVTLLSLHSASAVFKCIILARLALLEVSSFFDPEYATNAKTANIKKPNNFFMFFNLINFFSICK